MGPKRKLKNKKKCEVLVGGVAEQLSYYSTEMRRHAQSDTQRRFVTCEFTCTPSEFISVTCEFTMGRFPEYKCVACEGPDGWFVDCEKVTEPSGCTSVTCEFTTGFCGRFRPMKLMRWLSAFSDFCVYWLAFVFNLDSKDGRSTSGDWGAAIDCAVYKDMMSYQSIEFVFKDLTFFQKIHLETYSVYNEYNAKNYPQTPHFVAKFKIKLFSNRLFKGDSQITFGSCKNYAMSFIEKFQFLLEI